MGSWAGADRRSDMVWVEVLAWSVGTTAYGLYRARYHCGTHAKAVQPNRS